MEKLAFLGGPQAADELNIPRWPPVDEATALELADLYRSGNWSFGGPHELQFAADFAAAHGAKYGIFMANGTVTLQCALAVLGIGLLSGGSAEDEVIMPALTWPATAMSAFYVGAKAVFADVEASTLCLDPAAFEAAITPHTKAVMPVHLYGGMADLDAIQTIADKHGIAVIEDCAHGQGGQWNGRGLGSHGLIGSFSFQQSKAMAAGESGICLTNDDDLAEKLYRAKHIGYAPSAVQGVYTAPPPEMPVYNFRATEFQALILQSQLKTLDVHIDLYNRNAAQLEARLRGVSGVRVQSRGLCATRQSYYAFAVIFDDPTIQDVPLPTILEALRAEGLSIMLPTYGVVYQHLLFNVAPATFRVEDGRCAVAEEIGQGRTAVLAHQWLGADDASIEKIGDAIAKVARSAPALRAHVSGEAPVTPSVVE